MSGIYNIGHCVMPGGFQTVSRGQELVFFYRHSTRKYLMKEKQGGPIPMGLKRWPLKLIKHLADTTCISPSPAGPAGCCPLNFLYLVNLKFRWVYAYSSLGQTKVLYATSFVLIGAKPSSCEGNQVS